MLNSVVLVGRLTRDPVLRKTNSGNSVVSFSIAVDSPMKKDDGTRGTTFLDCTVFNQQAENVFKFVKKGSLVGVEGSLNQSTFTRKDGTNGSKIEVICNRVSFLEPKGADSANRADSSQSAASSDLQDDSFEDDDSSSSLQGLDVADDDLPF